MKRTYVILFGLVALFILAWFPFKTENGQGNSGGEIIINGKNFQVEILDTDEKRVRGLSGRDVLREDTVMLFIFPKEDRYGIWMKDMNFAIDILWLNKNFEIIHIEENISPQTFPHVFYPVEPALYVVEANAHFVSENQIRIGEKLEFYKK